MKKRTILVIFVIAVLFMAGCNSTKASARAVSVAKRAISIADQYLDGELSYSKASDELDRLKDDMEYVDSVDRSDPSRSYDFAISVDLTLLSHDILMDDIDKSAASYDDVIDTRNKLAADAGLKKRK